MKSASSDPLSDDESFYSDFDWYMGHVQSLAMSPEDCCADQGNFRVAGELFYFLLLQTALVDPKVDRLSSDQLNAVESLRKAIQQVPQEARSGGPTAAESLADMSNEAWEMPRSLANDLLALMRPLKMARDAYYPSSR